MSPKSLNRAMKAGLEGSAAFLRKAVLDMPKPRQDEFAQRVRDGWSFGVEFTILGRTAMAAFMVSPEGERTEIARRDVE